MTTITTNELNVFATKFLTIDGEINTTVKNLIKHHKDASIVNVQCPSDNFILTMSDGSTEHVSSALLYLKLTSASKTAFFDVQGWKYGRLVKGILIPEYATQVYTGIRITKTAQAVKSAVITASMQLVADIRAGFSRAIDDLNSTCASATSVAMITEYLSIAPSVAELSVDGLLIDISTTKRVIAAEALQEVVVQIESTFAGTKAEYESTVIDNKTIEVQLSAFDASTIETIIARLESFKLKGSFDPDKSKILTKLGVQVLTVAL